MMDVEKLQYEKNLMKNSNVSKISTENINTENINIHEHLRTLQYLKGWKKQKEKKIIYNAKIAINHFRKKMES